MLRKVEFWVSQLDKGVPKKISQKEQEQYEKTDLTSCLSWRIKPGPIEGGSR